MNFQAIRVIYKFEMLRTWNTLMQSILSPVISTVERSLVRLDLAAEATNI